MTRTCRLAFALAAACIAGVGSAAAQQPPPVPDAVTVLDLLRRLPQGRASGEGGWGAVGRDVTRAPGTAVAIGAVVPEVRDREIIVTLPAGSDRASVLSLARQIGLDGEVLYTSTLLDRRVVRLRIPDQRPIATVLQQLALDPRVDSVQPHYVYTGSAGPAGGALPVPQYAPGKLNLAKAHALAQGKRIKVAVIDTAVDAGHPALQGAVADTFNALATQGDAKGDAHGTAIAGIVAARAGLESVAPQADLLAARAFLRSASGAPQSDTITLLKSLDWAVTSGARVINMSFAGPEDPLLGRAIAAAITRGVTVVAAAGNGGPDAKPAYPAAYPDVVAVTASDSRDELYQSANRGAYIAVAAPGVDIVAAAPDGAYDISSGTSLAAAHVSGVAALLLERDGAMTPAALRAVLTSSARKGVADTRDDGRGGAPTDFGAGIVDAAEAVSAVR
ncbi:MAG: S8 family serine peptidase [Hyphomicrobium sp.]